MDWGRAKNILLVVLIATNIFLISVYGIRYEQSRENNSELYSYTISQLEKNNISLDCAIPEHPSRLTSLTIQYGRYDSSIVNKAVKKASEESLKIRDDEDFIQAADNLVEKCGLKTPGTSVAQTVHEENGAVTVEYENRYENIPLQECYMKVIFQDGKIERLERKWMEPVEEGETRLEITEPATALLSFIDIVKKEREDGPQQANTLENVTQSEQYPQIRDLSSQETAKNTNTESEKITVNKLDLVYYVENGQIDREILYDTAFPAWRIEYGDGEIKYISAFEQ